MSETIDKRIVEMRFNNKDFEKHANESIKTLDQLKKSMEMDNATTSIDKIAQSVEKLEHRFSAMGIVGKRVIENLTDSAMNLLNKTQAFLSGGIISGGIKRAMNLEKARFTLNGLLDTAEEAEKVVTIAGNSVADTAYSLDQAAVVASQFAASGLTAATAENKLEKALRGVAGVAAITNSDYASLGRIFTQVSGQGRLMGNDLLQLSTRGMNAAATLTDIFNKVNSGEIEAGDAITDMGESTVAAIKEITGGMQITESELRDLVSKSKVSFDIFAESMNAAFGDKAQEADKTVTGAFANIKAALARIGEAFVSPLIKKEGPLVQFLNTAKARINDFKKVLTQWTDDAGNVHNTLAPANAFVYMMTKTLERMTDRLKNLDLQKLLRPMYNVMFGIQNVMRSVLDVAKTAKRAFRDIFPDASLGKLLASISERFYKFSETLKITWERGEKFRRVFRGLWAIVDIGKTALQAFLKVFGPDISKAIGNASGKLLDFSAGIGDVLVGIRNWIKESNVFENVFTKLHALFSFVTSILRTVGSVIQKTFTFITNKVRIFVSAASEGVWNGIKAVFSSITSDVDSMWTHIKTAMGEGWNWLSSHGPFKAAKSAVEAVKEYFADSKVFNFILDAFRKLKSGIQSIIDSFKEIKMDGATSFMEKFKSKFSWLGAIVDFFKAAGRLILKYGKEAWEVIKAIGKGIGEAFEPTVRAFTDGLNHIVENSDLGDVGILAAGSQLALVFYRLSKVFGHVTHLAENAAGVVAGIKGFFFKLGRALKGAKWLMYAESIKTFAKSILILAGALFILALIPTDSLVKGTAAIITLIEAMKGVMVSLASVERAATGGNSGNPVVNFLQGLGTSAASMGVQMLLLAGAIAVLTAAVGILGNMEYETLMKGVVMIALMIKMLSTAVVSMGKNASQGFKAAAVLLAMALAINALILPMIIFGAILQRGFKGGVDAGTLTIGASMMIALLTEITLMIALIAKATEGVDTKGAIGMSLILTTLSLVVLTVVASLALLIAAISGLEVNTKHVKFSHGSDDAIMDVFLLLGGLIGGLIAFTFAIGTMTDQFDSGDMLKMAAVVVAIGLSLKLILSAIIPLAALSLLALPAAISMLIIMKTISGLLHAVSEMGKIQDPKGVVSVLLSLAAAIAIISYCIFQMAKLDTDALFKGGLAVAAAIAGLLYVANLVATNGAMATGLYELTGIFIGFGIAAVLFAAAIWIIIDAFEKLDASTESAADSIRKKIEAVCSAITGSADDIALAFGSVVGAIILAIADAIVEAWEATLRSLFKLIEQTMDALIDYAPTVVPKIAKAITIILDELDKYLPQIIDAAIKTALIVINSLAITIRNRSTAIVMAIDNVLDAVWSVVLKALLKFFGVAKSKWDDYLYYLKGFAKRATVVIASIFAISKIKKWTSVIGGAKLAIQAYSAALVKAKAASALLGGGFEGATFGMQVFGKQAGGMIGTVVSGLGKIASFLGPYGTIAVAVGAVAIKASLAFKRYVDAMKVVDDETEILTSGAEAYMERYDKIMGSFNDALKESHDGIIEMGRKLNDESSAAENLRDKLLDLVDSNGKVKQGSEELAKNYVQRLNEQYGTQYTIVDNLVYENGILKGSYDEVAESIENVIATQKKQSTLDMFKDQYEEAQKGLRDYDKTAADAMERSIQSYKDAIPEYEKNIQLLSSIYDVDTDEFDLGLLYAQRDQLRDFFSDISDEDWKKIVEEAEDDSVNFYSNRGLFGKDLSYADIMGDKIKNYYDDYNNMMRDLGTKEAGLEKMTKSYETNIRHIRDYEALMSAETTEDINSLTDKIKWDLKSRTEANGEELKQQYDDTVYYYDKAYEAFAKDQTKATYKMLKESYNRRYLAFKELQPWQQALYYKDFAMQQTATKKILDKYKDDLADIGESAKQASNEVSESMSTVVGKLSGSDYNKLLSQAKNKFNADSLEDLDISQFLSLDTSVLSDDGKNIVKGLSTGVTDNKDVFGDSMDTLANEGIDTFDGDFVIESPSKAMYERGKYIVQGLANGIKRYTGLASYAMESLAGVALDKFDMAMASGNIQAFVPIVDLSGIQNGIRSSVLDTGKAASATLNGMLSTKLAASIDTAHLDEEFDRIVESLKTMNDNIVNIGNRVNKLKVVMDTGALVGQLAAPMDGALGGMAMYKRRGI